MGHTRCVAAALAVALVCFVLGGCGRTTGSRVTEKTMNGKWEIDREALARAGRHLDEDVKVSYEFNADGTGSETRGGAPQPATWTVVATEGDTVVLEFITKEEKRPRAIRVTALDDDRLKLYCSVDFGECRLKRTK
ncbi:MAG TPA: hypothetical protein VG013_22260 [Gemmataceae bacterium]|jgi:hypothetical protein|nr:hypothetical protein [Gemmataceae bacterium]